MIDPELTKVLGRRILASIVNLVAVGAISLMIISIQAQRFVITQRNSDGNPVWPRYSDEGLRLAELDETFNRALTVGDNFYVWNTPALFVSGLIITLISLVVWVLIPASLGWSPGHRLLGLKVVTMDGQEPPLDGYLRRYVVGLVDLFPFVIPGLLGWLTASRNEHSQRIGDLSGDTVVVDAKAEIRLIDATAYVNRTNQMIDVGGAIADQHAQFPNPTFSPDQVVAEAEAAQASPWTEPAVEPEKQDLYIPTHIDAPPETTHGDVPPVETASDEPSAPTPAGAVPGEVIAESEVIWSQPVAEPAPVWEPEPSAEQPPGVPTTAPATPETAAPAPVAAPAQPATQPTAAQPGAAAQPAAGSQPAVAPTWSDDWQAWLFWDHVNQRWLRHVEDDDSWLPIN